MPVHPKNYIYNCNSYINIIHNQIDNYYSVCPALTSSILNSFTEEESTINWGSEFQSLITLLLKNLDLVYEFT